jgi:hypothetical protein
MLCYRCYRGLGGLVVLYFSIYVIENLEGWLSYNVLSMLYRTWKLSYPILCYLCNRGRGGLVDLYFAIYVIENLEG